MKDLSHFVGSIFLALKRSFFLGFGTDLNEDPEIKYKKSRFIKAKATPPQGKPMVNSPLIRPYLLGGSLGGYLRFP